MTATTANRATTPAQPTATILPMPRFFGGSGGWGGVGCCGGYCWVIGQVLSGSYGWCVEETCGECPGLSWEGLIHPIVG